MAGIYIHIPFCKKSCSYCDFHFSTQTSYVGEMVDCIKMEITQRSNEVTERVDSIYFGGGTPSLLQAAQIDDLLGAIRDNYGMEKHIEISLEANPDDLEPGYLQNLSQSEVNRLSIGFQSFHDPTLKSLGRIHTGEQGLQVIESSYRQGMGSLSGDIIYGIPGRSLRILENDLEKIVQRKVGHISCYALTIEERTALHSYIKRGLFPEPIAEDQNKEFYFIKEYLESHGYEHYELSNYAMPGQRSYHNSNYWQRTNYLGFGPSAHSHIDGRRRWNISNNTKYIEAIRSNNKYYEEEQLSDESIFNEKIMVGLRLKEGIDLSLFESEVEYLKETGKKFMKMGWLEQSNTHLKATSEGMLWLDTITADIFKV